MKSFLVMAALMFAGAGSAAEFESKIECSVHLKPVGIYYTYCPKGSLMDANGTRVSHVGNSIFVTDQVRCVTPEVVCTTKPEKVQGEDLELED